MTTIVLKIPCLRYEPRCEALKGSLGKRKGKGQSSFQEAGIYGQLLSHIVK